MSKFRKTAAPLLLVTLLCSAAALMHAEDISVLGREIKAQNENAVITVRLVIKQKTIMKGKELYSSETKSDITGTLIDPSGLTVVSLTATEPATLLSEMMGERANEMQFSMESEISDIKLRLNDGQELPAKVVLRDKDFDLAFIEPATKTAALPYINTKENTQPQLLDQVIGLTRMGKIASWDVFVNAERIEGIIQKPRTLYFCGSSTPLGSPIFSAENKFIGIVTLHTAPSGGGDFNPASFLMGNPNFIPVITPAADILETGKQITAPAEDKNMAESEKPAEQE